jgi:acetylornithine deacetylase/succinyl-diaminopimelate desuccinylase-like protein
MHPVLEQVDWEREGEAVVELLRALLQFDTTNPPGNEAECVAFLADHLRGVGVEPEVLSPSPGRANLVARLPGSNGGQPPLLLNGHVDVVAAEAGRWRHPPFAGEVHDGAVWGRGAVDMKQMVAMSVAVVGLLARLGVRLRRDLKLAAVADEEAGCAAGSAWLVDHHPDMVRAGHALGEVGGATSYLGRRPFYPIQVAEKGVAWLRATATGVSGHGSIPRDDNAVVRLSEFLARVGRRRLPLHPSPELGRFLAALAAVGGRPARALMPLLLRRGWSEVVLRRAVRDPGTAWLLAALLRNTASPTVVHAGHKTNVIPGRAEAELDGRIAVGSSEAELLAELRALASPGIELELVAPQPPADGQPTRLRAVRHPGRRGRRAPPGCGGRAHRHPRVHRRQVLVAAGHLLLRLRPGPAGADRSRLRLLVPRRRRAHPGSRPQGRPAHAGRRGRPPLLPLSGAGCAPPASTTTAVKYPAPHAAPNHPYSPAPCAPPTATRQSPQTRILDRCSKSEAAADGGGPCGPPSMGMPVQAPGTRLDRR